MYQGYRRIFWGIFFTTFHITIGNLQILPSFIGYLVIHSGIKCVIEEFECDNLRKASNITVLATVVAIISGLLDLGLIESFQTSEFSLVWLATVSVLELLYVYYLLSGSVELLEQYKLTEMAESYTSKIKIFIVLYSIFAIAGIVGITFDYDVSLTFFAIAIVIIKIWLMMMISALKNAGQQEI